MNKEEIISKFKDYVVRELEEAESEPFYYNGHDAVSRCFGALMFLFSLGIDDRGLESWWDDEMRPRFYDLERR